MDKINELPTTQYIVVDNRTEDSEDFLYEVHLIQKFCPCVKRPCYIQGSEFRELNVHIYIFLLSVEFHTVFPRIVLHCVVSISNYKIIIIPVVNTKNNNLEASFKSNAAVETIIFSKFI